MKSIDEIKSNIQELAQSSSFTKMTANAVASKLEDISESKPRLRSSIFRLNEILSKTKITKLKKAVELI